MITSVGMKRHGAFDDGVKIANATQKVELRERPSFRIRRARLQNFELLQGEPAAFDRGRDVKRVVGSPRPVERRVKRAFYVPNRALHKIKPIEFFRQL